MKISRTPRRKPVVILVITWVSFWHAGAEAAPPPAPKGLPKPAEGIPKSHTGLGDLPDLIARADALLGKMEKPKLSIQRRDVRRQGLQAIRKEYDAGRCPVDGLLQAVRDSLAAELDLCQDVASRRAQYESSIKYVQELEDAAQKKRPESLEFLRIKGLRLDLSMTLEGERTLGRRSPQEIAALRVKVRALKILYERIAALQKNGFPGGDAANLCQSGHELARAMAELSLASGDKQAALVSLKDDLVLTDGWLKSVQAIFDAGSTTVLDRLTAAIAAKCEAQLALSRLRRGEVCGTQSHPLEHASCECNHTR